MSRRFSLGTVSSACRSCSFFFLMRCLAKIWLSAKYKSSSWNCDHTWSPLLFILLICNGVSKTAALCPTRTVFTGLGFVAFPTFTMVDFNKSEKPCKHSDEDSVCNWMPFLWRMCKFPNDVVENLFTLLACSLISHFGNTNFLNELSVLWRIAASSTISAFLLLQFVSVSNSMKLYSKFALNFWIFFNGL